MGKFDFEVSPEFIKSLGRLADIDRVAPKMIDAATPVLVRNVKREMQNHKRTGAMLNSVKATKAKLTKKGGYFASVRPTGTSQDYINESGKKHKRKEPVRNMEILAHLEYGTKDQPATPILPKALNDSRSEIEQIMAQTFKEEMSK